MTTALAFSNHQSVTAAIAEIWQQISPQLDSNKPSLLILYTNTPETNHNEFADHLKKAAPDSFIIGCSTSGITSATAAGFTTAIIAIQSPDITIKTSVVSHISKKDPDSNRRLLQSLIQKIPPQLMFIFTDGLNVGTQDLLNHLDQKTNIIGAGAGDANKYQLTNQYFEKQAIQDSAVAAGIFGNLQAFTASIQPNQQITEDTLITKANDNHILEIDHQPAQKYFEDIFGKELFTDPTKNIPDIIAGYPLKFTPPAPASSFIANALHFKNGEVITNFTIPANTKIAVTTTKKKTILAQADTQLTEIAQLSRGKKIQFILVITSPTHDKLLLNQPPTFTEIIQEKLGKDIPIIIINAYAQITTDPKTQTSQLLNASTQFLVVT